MPLPCPSGQISLGDIQGEFGGSNPISINEYYVNGGLVPPNTGTVPTSGQISFSDFFCAANEVVIYITRNIANVNVEALFGTNWTRNIRKRLVINPGVIVYSTTPYNVNILNGYALRIFDTFKGRLTIQNFGSIQGAAGRRGGDTVISGESRTSQSNGGNGGHAIYIGPSIYGGTEASPRPVVYIDNQGTIYAGGGGGGQGAVSGTISPAQSYSYRPYGSCCPLDITIQGKGVTGGFGGWGQGYNQSNTSGSDGTPSGAIISVNMYSLGSNGWRFPPNSDINYTAGASGQNGIHRFGSNTVLNYNMNSSGTPGGLSFNGANNTITLNRYSSGFTGTLTKDPNQTFVDNRSSSGPIGSVINVAGGGPEQTPGILYVSTNGVEATIGVPIGQVAGRGGNGGTWGNSGASAAGSGGSPGFSIVNASRYVSYINQGTIAGSTT